MPTRHAAVLAGLLLLAAWLRLTGLDWDQGQHLHPDERFLTMVATDVRMPRAAREYFDTSRSPLNPANVGRGFFVYGTFPLVLVRGVSELIGSADYGRIHLVGRAAAALFDVGTVALTYRIGAALAGPAAGLTAAALMTFSVISIQQAHFFTVDSFATFFVTAAICMLVRVAAGGGLPFHALFGVFLGFALACRLNLVLLGAVYLVALARARRTGRAPARRLAAGVVLAAAAAVLIFRVFQPYAFAGPGFFTLELSPDFLQSLRTIRGYVTGAVDYPPSLQWISRLPVVSPGKDLVLWSLGPPWALAALVGLIDGFVRRSGPEPHRAPGTGLVVLLWVPLLFLFHAVQFAATGRYFLPMVPLLAVASGALFARSAPHPRAWRCAGAVVLVLTALWALAFTAIYRRPHTRVEASGWIYEHVPPGTSIATEHWDDALPLSLPGRTPDIYTRIQLKLYDEETEDKRRQLVAALDAADVIVLSSNRLYRAIPRAPWRYPLARRYYELLFAGELGFRLERVFTSYPRLGALEIPDDAAEEAFTVYDHPKVLVFRKTRAYSGDRTSSLLGAVSLAGLIRVPPREAAALYRRTRPSDVRLDEERAARSPVAPSDLGSLAALTRWLAAVEILSLAWFALLFRPLAAVHDRGYGLAKLLAWLAPGTAAWWLASTGLAPHTLSTVRGVGLALVATGGWVAWRGRRDIARWFADERRRRDALAIEAVFLGAFTLFIAIRAFNPAIFWGEKPMDYAILNAILRSPTMPPADPWFAGEPLNYPYLGHALTAVLATLSGVAPAFAFNLAVASVAAMLATGAFLFARQVTGRTGPGLLAVALVVLVGNLAGPRAFLGSPPPALDFNYFWATSRVIAGTINEFPFWTLLFADLHAHVLAMPLEMGLLYLGTLWSVPAVASRRARALLVAALAAWFLGAVSATSVWSAPLAAVLPLGFLLTAWREHDGRVSGLLRALGMWIGIVIAGCVAFWPFWARYAPPPRHWGWLTSEAAPLGDVATVFGVFLVLFLAVIVASVGRWAGGRRAALLTVAVVLAAGVGGVRSPSCALFAVVAVLGGAAWLAGEAGAWRTGALLVGVAGAVGIGTEWAFVWDRMNTVFKFYLQMWLLFASGTALLAWTALRRMGGWPRGAFTATLALAIGAGTFTSASDLVAWLGSPRAASRVPTIDGMAYLEQDRHSELAAFRWLNREVAGVPVVLEAQGFTYQAFSRVSMNTGLPTVLGWDYHLVQQNRSPEEIAARAREVRELYETTDASRAEQLLRKYHVDLVFVGPLERRTYAASGLAKFDASTLVEPVFRDAHVTIYATPGRRRSVKTWIDRVPRAALGYALHQPRGIAAARDGTFFVADFGNRRIAHLGADARPLGSFGTEGDGPGQFRDPCGIAVGPDGTLWVADTWNHRIQRLSADGRLLSDWRADLYGPRGIAVSPEGVVYVTDTGHHRVVRFTAEGKADVLVPPGTVASPVGIAVGRAGTLYVADVGHRRVAVFSKAGHFLRAWSVDAWSPPGPFVEPYLAVGPDGAVWVTDPTGRRVLLFDRRGRQIGVALASSPLELPMGIAVIDRDTAMVMDAGTGRVIQVRRPRQRPS